MKGKVNQPGCGLLWDTAVAMNFIAFCARFTGAGGLFNARRLIRAIVMPLLGRQFFGLKKYEFKTPGFHEAAYKRGRSG